MRGLEKSFGGLRVTGGVTLAVEPGERRLIIGPNGAGKTTLFNLITGEIRPDAGAVTLFDRDITRVPCRRRPHLGIARTYQIITLFPRDTLLRNVMLSLLGLSRLRWNPFVGLARTYQIITLFPKDTLEHNIALSLLGLSKDRWKVFSSHQDKFSEEARGVLALVGL